MELQPEFPLNGSSSSSSSSNDTTAADGASPPSVSLVATGVGLYSLSFLTFVGNAMVLHAIRTEKRLQTVRRRDKSVYDDGHAKSYSCHFPPDVTITFTFYKPVDVSRTREV